MKSTTNHTLLAGFAVALALLGGVAWFGWRHISRMQETAERVHQTERVLDALDDLHLQLQDIETGARGFVITGDPAFLKPFEDSLGKVNDQFRALRAITRDNPRQQSNCDTLEPLIARRVALAEVNVDLRRNSGFEAAQQEVAGGKGKAVMDQIRAVIARMEAEEKVLLVQRSAAAQSQTSTTALLAATGSGLSFVLLITVFALVLRENRTRQRAQAELDRFFTLSLDMLCIASADGYFKRISPAFMQTLGWSVEEILARPFLNFVHPDDRPATLREVERQVVAGEKVLQFENRYQHKDGTWRVLAWKSVPQPGGFMFATARDVTEKKEAEAKLRVSEERFRALATASARMIWRTDAQGLINEPISDWEAFVGQAPGESVKNDWDRFIHPDDVARLQAQFAQGLAAKKTFAMEFRARRQDGVYRDMISLAAPVLNPDGTVREWVGSLNDVTEKKEAEAEIRKLNADLQHRAAQLEAANKELEAFSYSVSHDLRAPLRHIDGYVEMLTKHAGDTLSDKSRRYLKIVSESAGEMGQLIDDLLAFSRMGRTEMQRTTVNLELLVQELIASLRSETTTRNIVWKNGNLPIVEGDPSMLKQAFVNLLSNAVKYTRRKDPAEIEIGCASETTDEVVMFVRDNGAGFDMKYVDKLFGVFQRLHRAEEFEGTGVGLANVRRIISRHGGRIWAEGAVNNGATFYFSLTKPRKG